MSFSGNMKNELCRQTGGARHCQIAELKAMQIYAGEKDVFRTENLQIAEKYALLLKKLFRIREPAAEEQEEAVELRSVKGRRGRPAWCVTVRDPETAERVRETVAHAIVRKDCCRRAFLRGAFLAAGSMSDPGRSYHCEIVCEDEPAAELLAGVLRDLQISARIARRKQNYIVYVKESSDLADVIGLMGARVARMDFENARILKEMRENVNRKVNCETANINKTVSAAVRQIEDIRLIERTVGFRHLPKGLDEMARVRLQYPEATLQELGQMLNPQVGKSGVNHRLRKLGKIADAIRGTKEERVNGKG